MKTPVLDMSGQKFGRLTVLSLIGSKPTRWLCQCSCGNTKIVRRGDLTTGKTLSCGCLKREILIKRTTVHGLRHENKRLYNIWLCMRQRCHNSKIPEYKNYGGRGITVCKEWDNYAQFHDWALSNGYLPNLTIERINVNDGYYPDNCTWKTIQEQQMNRTTARMITIDGVTKHLTEWADEVGLYCSTITNRIDYKGWDEKRAVFTPSLHSSWKRRVKANENKPVQNTFFD